MTKQRLITLNSRRRFLALDCASFMKEQLLESDGDVELWDIQRMEAFACDETQVLEKESYDYLFLGDYLERYSRPQQLLRRLRQGLKDSGRVVSIWHVKENLLHYLSNLFMSTKFRDLQVSRCNDTLWEVSACLYEKDILFLRSKLSEQERLLLGRWVRRLEFGISHKEGFLSICRLCDCHALDMEYLRKFIEHTSLHPQAVEQRMVDMMREMEDLEQHERA